MTEMTMAQALNRALREEMQRDERVIVLGEDVGVDGGVFRITDELQESFGADRVIDTPLAESAIVGTSLGMALAGLRPVCELQFSGFSYFGFHQLEAHVARLRWRSRGRFTVPMVVRMPYGAGVRALEHHSESRETYFAHTPGLKTVTPSGPRNARALLASAIRDPDPVIFLEPKRLYRAFKEDVPDEPETIEIGRARRVRHGDAATLVSYGSLLPRVVECADQLANSDDIHVDVIDLVTLAPLDSETIVESVRRTGRLAVVHEAPRSFGPAGEIMARVNEACFYELRAPMRRVTGYDTIVPLFAREQAYLPDQARISEAVRELIASEA
jgi:pyruvate dehydrogenase E1 component beta subunit